MFCPKCGVENAEGAAFCSACGNALNPAPVEDTVPVSEEVAETVETPTTEEAPKKDLLAPIKPLLEKAKPFIEKVKPFIEKNKLFVAAGAGVLALVLCIALLCSIFGGGNGYTPLKQTMDVFVEDGEVYLSIDAKKVKKLGLEADGLEETQTNIDGTILALLTDKGQLAVVKGSKLIKVAEDVLGFFMSADGTGIAYGVENDDGTTLMLYNVKNKKSVKVTDYLVDSSLAISPNGDSVVYFEQREDDEEASMMYFKGKKSKKVTSAEVSVIGMSNNGKYIYCIGKDDEGVRYMYSYNTKGDRNKLGKCSYPVAYFNEDHTQIAFFNNDEGYKTYISTKGKEAKKISSSMAYPMLPGNVSVFSNGSSSTVPTDDLYNKVYECESDKGASIWFIRKNADRSEKLVGNVTRTMLSQDAKYVYYVDDNELKVLTVKKGDNAADKAKTLAEDVDSYVVTSNNKKLYYTSDGALYCINAQNGKGKKTVANDEVETYLAINAKDVVYYIMDGDCYATKNGSKGKKVVSDADDLSTTANGIVYIETSDAIFATKGPKKPTKIFTND